MSESSTSTNGERKLTSVLSGGSNDGKPLKIVRPSKLAEEGVTGVVAEGIYTGTRPNPFEPANLDFRIEGDTEDFIINTTGSLKYQLNKVEVGTYVQIQYLGKEKAKKGPAAGKMCHNFVVLAEDIQD